MNSYNINNFNYLYTYSACKQLNKINYIQKNYIINDLYKRLFVLLNNENVENNLLIKIWIEHLNSKIEKFLSVLDECDNFIKNYSYKNIDNVNSLKLNNKQIETLYLISLIKKKEII